MPYEYWCIKPVTVKLILCFVKTKGKEKKKRKGEVEGGKKKRGKEV